MITHRISKIASKIATVIAVEHALRVIDEGIKVYEELIETAKRSGLPDYEGTEIWRYHTTIDLLRAARRTILWRAKRLGVNPRDLKVVSG